VPEGRCLWPRPGDPLALELVGALDEIAISGVQEVSLAEAQELHEPALALLVPLDRAVGQDVADPGSAPAGASSGRS
jgi:hypothetical protein